MCTKMSIFKGKDGTGKEKTFIREDEYVLPSKQVERFMKDGVKKRLEEMRDFEVRDDDLLICAYMKSGTHWLWEIVSMVINKTSEYDKNHKEVAMMEFRTPQELHALKSPRFLNLHYCPRSLPRQAIQKKIPIIHIMRNPKDVCVSFYNHYKTIYENVENFSAFLPMFLGENGFHLFYPWFKYELEWEQFIRDHPDHPILNLYYEDMKQNLATAVQKVAEFLKVDIGNELVEQIADRCHIDKMRNATKENDHHKRFIVDGRPLMYRKGEVGDWKNWLTVAENERFDRWLEENLKHTDLKFKYTLD